MLKRKIAFRAVLFAVALAGALSMLLPLIWMASTSLKQPSEVFSMPPKLIPSKWVWSNYGDVWHSIPFGRFYINSLLVTFSVVVGQVLTSSMSAYAFARLSFPGRDKLFFCYLATLMVPGAVTLIPVFIIMKLLGSFWRVDLFLFNRIYVGAPLGLNSYFALIVPGLFSAYGTFLLRQFFLGIPTELEEATKIDGGGHYTIFTRVILPLSMPAVTTLAIFTMLGSWRDFLWPLVIVNTNEMKTLPVGLAAFQGMYSTDWALLMAASLMVMAPLVVVFLFAQRFFIEGIKMQGLKG